MSLKIYVIIVTYKGHQWYERCFTSLRNSEYPVQTIVIDNASNDGTVEYIREHFPEIHLIESKENLGFGRANNIGMRYALDHGCDYVFLLNQDAWIEADSILKLVTIAGKNQEYAIISPMHMMADKRHLNFLLDDGNRNYELLSDLYTNNLKDLYTIRYVNAAAWLLPRNTLITIGGFCPLIFHYGEDDDYMNRVHFHGFKIGLVPSSLIVHDTKKRLSNSLELAKKAQYDDMDLFLDITKQQSIVQQKISIIRNCIRAIISRDSKQRNYFFHRYKILSKRQKDISQCREQHKIKQANWL